MRRRLLVAIVVLWGCESRGPAPPARLPDPPAPMAPAAVQLEDAPAPNDPRLPPRPQPTGDREADALSLGFWGCRIMGLRLAPAMSGRAWLSATLAPSGEVADVTVDRVESLPHPVVQCLVDRVARARFDPRGGNGSEIHIPVDFTRPTQGPALPTLGSAPIQSL